MASLILRLLLRQGAQYKIAVSAAIVATILVVIEINATQSLTTMWGPQLVVLPFVTFMVAALATCRGDAFGLLVCSFSAATLVHGYIPTIPAAAPVWMIAVILGRRARHRETGRGFPLAAWVGVAAISAVFALPIIVDMIIHPPGNVVRVILAGFEPPVGAPHSTIRQVAGFYFRQFKSVSGWWWLIALVGAATAHRLETCRRLYVDSGILVLAGSVGSLVFFVKATSPLASFMFLYLLGVFLVFPLLGFVTVMATSTVREKAANAMAVAALVVLAVKSMDGSMESFAPPFRDGPELVRAIADDFPPQGEAAFTVKDAKLFTPALAFTAGMMVALSTEDRRSCITNPEYGFIVTPGRICSAVPAAEGRRRYTVERQPGGPCVTEGLSGDLDTALLYKRDSLCLVIRRTDG
ncbi:hypothetical protein [Azospirillum griseum]|uniref:Uncharacterized protein n=1 Tax=Azospirillum griseum TaxID=2496639 RepID=A0A431V9R1_9PROT|nr:hypothetical protein [Azospirillum griseum]RTR12225.1 hypothetical protein EJ903_25620 [Azospirillum griseum]